MGGRPNMKTLMLCSLAACVFCAAGCPKTGNQPQAQGGGAPAGQQKDTGVLEAPGAYIETVVSVKIQSEIKLKKMNVENFIKQFQAMNERFPASLDEIKKNGALDNPPSGFHWTYEPKTGAVDLVKDK